MIDGAVGPKTRLAIESYLEEEKRRKESPTLKLIEDLELEIWKKQVGL